MKNKFIILLLFSILNIIDSFNFNHLLHNKININNNKKIKDIKTLPLDKLPNYNTYINDYWYDPRIHNFGNIGFYGLLHAIIAPIASKLIDYLSYSNINVRKKILNSIPYNYSVIDFCCGIGFSTYNNSIGIDTSNEMLSIAKIINNNKHFINSNVENYGYVNSCDVVTIMFATHEMPSYARRKVIINALKNAKKNVLIVDIDPYNFATTLINKPQKGAQFISGEPYILNYILEMNADINYCYTTNFLFWKLEKKNIISNHVVLWNFTHRF
jgi:hypothetical protein|tara:strand:- start:826 stop:1638 length:813 start_codon:yes stop_codon:yes gene_type:complete